MICAQRSDDSMRVSHMRVVLFISFLLAVGGVADAVFFDSTYRAAVIDEAGYQGQIFIYKVDSFIRSISPGREPPKPVLSVKAR